MWLWILLGLVGALVALFVIIVIVGYRLPDTYKASGSVIVRTTPDELWARLANFESLPRAGRMCRGVERLPDVEGLLIAASGEQRETSGWARTTRFQPVYDTR